MRRVLLLITALGCVTAAAVVATGQPEKGAEPAAGSRFTVTAEAKNPWTSLAPNVAPDQFQFAVVSDRTGGHRKGVFSRAVQQVNLLQPEFVMSVGDLIEGAATADRNRAQWDEFDKYARQFNMPFFYCAGNHDGSNQPKAEVWAERLGRAYYHFTYQNCLFLVLNSNDLGLAAAADAVGPKQGIGKDQQAYIEKALKENEGVRWTFVFLHHPVWAARDLTENGWPEVEKLLAGRKYNVFCGHVHVFRKFLRNGTSYYQLATTGGSSAMRGVEYGEFDQVAWVTMKAGGPAPGSVDSIADRSSFITPSRPIWAITGPRVMEGLHDVAGKVTLNGKPAAGPRVR